ncbi:MAG: tRNA glutamyl-Q(34) synthetase GluQRS [Verrucomicrobiota bacterium]|nr:tRNA glutamyl-Q(34) synthetase GluQRS [Verrucomicrobiota bacterium]
MNTAYRSRIAPSPTGYMHLGHARTFWIAQQRCRSQNGTLVFRNEDIDTARARPEYVTAMLEDLRWFGLEWQEGPDCGGPHQPYSQSQRLPLYKQALDQLIISGALFPCICTRQDVLRSTNAPHAGEDEPLYPGTCHNLKLAEIPSGKHFNWRFKVPNAQTITFNDGNFGEQHYLANRDFGDFIIWRHDGLPSYQLAVTVDDAAMQITEVVRGADLLKSTARQLLLYQALNLSPPRFYHCELLRDEQGRRLAKRHDSLSLRQLRQNGKTPEELRAQIFN